MKKIKRAASAASAAALALSLIVPLSASAADSHIVVMNYGSFGGGEKVVLKVGDGENVKDVIYSAYDYDRYYVSSVMYPEPVDGKAVVGWSLTEGGAEYDLTSAVTADIELYPVTADTVDAGTIAVTVDESELPVVGDTIPSDISAFVSVPDGFKVTEAGYTAVGDETAFEDNKTYFLSVSVIPDGNKVFDYTYSDDCALQLSVDGATVNGSKANVKYESYTAGELPLRVIFPVTLGQPETYDLTLHYGGRGNVEDKTVKVPVNARLNPGLLIDQASGESNPVDDGYVLVDWFTDPQFAQYGCQSLDTLYINGDTELYARWAKIIDELNFTIETPLCGDVVETSEDLPPEELTTALAYAADIDFENVVAETIEFSNEPVVTCDVEGIEAYSRWITTDVPFAELNISTQVELFLGTIYGENDYTFVLEARPGDGEPVYFAKNLKITVNETVAGTTFSGGAKPSTKGGFVSNATVVSKGGNNFTVVGMITADHVWDSGVITKKAGCEDKGVMTYTCRSKDASYNDDIDPYGHKWLEWTVVKPATATEDGLEMRVCDNDGEHMQTRIIPRTGQTTPADTVDDGSTNAGTGVKSAAAAAAVIVLIAAVFVFIRNKK
ncbi:MAG: InlB B-repeat-containing protein [Ruminococcus sp.]|nr:InlB B-repeat-containing protein [Ruminococcus sp.]